MRNGETNGDGRKARCGWLLEVVTIIGSLARDREGSAKAKLNDEGSQTTLMSVYKLFVVWECVIENNFKSLFEQPTERLSVVFEEHIESLPARRYAFEESWMSQDWKNVVDKSDEDKTPVL